MNLIKENFEYLLSSSIEVLNNYNNLDYIKKIEDHYDLIEEKWASEQKRKGGKLFNGSILNLACIERDENRLLLHCHAIEYKHYLSQRLGVPLGIRPLGVSGIVFYKRENQKIFYLGKRSELVTQYPGYYEFIPSGSIDTEMNSTVLSIDYNEQLLIELKEELGISSDSVKTKNPFCLIFDEVDHVYDIGVEVEVSISKTETEKTEYSYKEELPLELINQYFKERNTVNTSKRLLKAWNVLNG